MMPPTIAAIAPRIVTRATGAARAFSASADRPIVATLTDRLRARDGRDRARVRLDVALMSHRREPADLVDDRVGIAGAQQHQRADKQRAFTHAAPLPLPLRATLLRPARLYPTPPVQTRRNDRW